MTESFSDRVIEAIGQAAALYHRLVLLVGPAGAGKTTAFRDIHERTDTPLLNVNLDLSRRMLELTERQRTLQLPRMVSEVVNAAQADVVLLDNIELLFDVSLKQDPLRLIQSLSRNKTLGVAWNGSIDRGCLTYATPEHPEYRRYSIRDLLLINTRPSEKGME